MRDSERGSTHKSPLKGAVGPGVGAADLLSLAFWAMGTAQGALPSTMRLCEVILGREALGKMQGENETRGGLHNAAENRTFT